MVAHPLLAQPVVATDLVEYSTQFELVRLAVHDG
jgi:hypothetical protein